MVREGSAKPSFAGSNPVGTSIPRRSQKCELWGTSLDVNHRVLSLEALKGRSGIGTSIKKDPVRGLFCLNGPRYDLDSAEEADSRDDFRVYVPKLRSRYQYCIRYGIE